MANPFPGMNPFLEDPACWRDFHQTFIGAWRESLVRLLPEHYDARLGEEVYLVQEDPESKQQREPDVIVVKPRKRRQANPAVTVGAATLAPVTIPIRLVDESHQGYIEVVHRPKRKVVAVLELLSPGNKERPGRTHYLIKRNALLLQHVHLVELDLLLHGRRVPLGAPLPPGDYYYLVSDANRSPDCDVYAWTMRQPLPTVPVPLLPPDSPVLCDLGAVFATTFERGQYERSSLQYRNNPRVRLRPEDLRWARQQLRAAGIRT
jgi:hypothetical protein